MCDWIPQMSRSLNEGMSGPLLSRALKMEITVTTIREFLP